MVSHHLAQLATTIDTALYGAARDSQFGAFHAAQPPPVHNVDKGCTVLFVEITHSACKDITAFGVLQAVVAVKFCQWHGAALKSVRRIVDVLVAVADGATADGDVDVPTTLREESFAVETCFGVAVCPHLSIARCCLSVSYRIKESIAYGSHTSAAIDGAEYLTTLDFQLDAASHITRRIGFTTEATSTAEDVAIDVGGAPCADCRAARCGDTFCRCLLAYGYRHVAQHMAVLTAAIYGAVDDAAGDFNFNILHVGYFIKINARVALSSTIDVAGHRILPLVA